MSANEDCDEEEFAAHQEQTKCFDEVHEWVVRTFSHFSTSFHLSKT